MKQLRSTSQLTAPVDKPVVAPAQYDIYPSHNIGDGRIFTGYASLAQKIAKEKKVVIDGYVGVWFERFKNELNKELVKLGVKALWWDVNAALKPEDEIDEMVAPFLGGDDPIFGFRTTLSLADFFDADRLTRIKADDSAPLNIIYGTGASLAGWNGMLVYLDVPKNEIQFRARAGSVTNVGASKPDAPKKMYKRFYFVDWVVLNRHKKELLPSIDVVVDAQREEDITWTVGEDLRAGLEMLATNALRVRPWFEPGAWGGQWIKEHIPTLPQDVPNYAWSFELIVPENGIMFESSGHLLEVSFDMVMFQGQEKVVGKPCYTKYADEFPIRMDYLDNFAGGNLSIQCHPRNEYARKNFGEVLTQEETYYILDSDPDSVVYLGFKEDIVPAEFEKALYESAEKVVELDVDKYVNSEPSEKHGLYLMPPGTLHSSGRNNLVLEISTTPYIFTFKMYDWLALDLDGKPRPLNIKRAMENLYFDRKGDKVRQELVSKPYALEKGTGWELWHLPTHEQHSYDIHRYVVEGEVEVQTAGRCHVLNLVEGQMADVVTANGKVYSLSYAETLVVSAAAGSYKIINRSQRPIMMVKAFMK